MGEWPALPVHKDMGLSFSTIVVCEQAVPLDMEFGDLGQLLGQGEADGCPAPRLLVFMVGQVQPEAWLLRGTQHELIAMAQGPMPTIWVEAGTLVARKHQGPDAGQPDGRKVSIHHSSKSHIVHGSRLLACHVLGLKDGCKQLLLVLMQGDEQRAGCWQSCC